MNALVSRIATVLIIAMTILCTPAADAAQYTYDQLGRLTDVVEADGSTAHYTYDANGNLLTIARTGSAPAVGVTSFAPATGPSGTIVTIRGVGFSTTISQNTVSFNGVAGTVTAANASQLIAVVPPAATTGPIAVTTPSGTATTAASFLVTTVLVSSFTPTRAVTGATVTINGTGFSTTPANNTVRFNTKNATVLTATATQLTVTVPAGVVSGKISVTTPAATGVSSADFFSPIGSHPAADVVMTGRLTPGSVGLVYTIESPGKLGVAVFDAMQGQRITLALTNRNLNGTFFLYAPDGTLVSSNYLSSGELLDLPAMPASGSYTLVLEAFTGMAGGSVTVRLVTDAGGSIATDGTPKMLTLVPGQNADLTFTATANQTFNLALLPYSTTPAGGALEGIILGADGNEVLHCQTFYSTSPTQGCRFAVPAPGTYRVRLDPWGGGTTSVSARLSADFAATMTPGTAVNVSLPRPGNQARLTFTATAGQSMTLGIASQDVPTQTNKTIFYEIYNPSGVMVTSFGSVNPSAAKTVYNLVSGTYVILIKPYETMATATMSATLALGSPGFLPLDGTAANFTSSIPGQSASFTFTANAGQNVSLSMTNLVMNPSESGYAALTIYRPDGGWMGNFYDYTYSAPGESLLLKNLPLSGTYTVVVDPNGSATMAFIMRAVSAVTGTLNTGTSIGTNLSIPGRATAFNFTAATGQTFALNVAGISTTPTGKTVTMQVENASGFQIGGASTAGPSMTANMPNLPAGTYTVFLTTANAAPATMQTKLVNGVTGILPLGSSATYSVTTAGQNGYFTFNGTAGQRLSLGATGLAIDPTSAGYVPIYVLKPDGIQHRMLYDYLTSDPGEMQELGALPATGTYTVVVYPNGQATSTFTLTLTQALVGNLVFGTPYQLSTTLPGQMAALTFTNPSVQTRTLNITSIATNPAGKTLSAEVRNASDIWIASAGSATGTLSCSLPNLPAGTYTVLISVFNASTASMQVTIQ